MKSRKIRCGWCQKITSTMVLNPLSMAASPMSYIYPLDYCCPNCASRIEKMLSVALTINEDKYIYE